jgi:ABC-type polysaccharide/polyol phosphate export permease
MNQLLWGGSLLGRIYIPKTVFAISAICSGLINLVIAILPLIGVMLVTGAPLRISLLFVPIAAITVAMFALGVSLLLSVIAVVFRDVVDMYQIALSAWYFLTPIMYPETIIPREERWWFFLNPMYHFVEVFRAPIYDGSLAGYTNILVALLTSICTLIVGWLVFTSRSDEIAYRL